MGVRIVFVGTVDYSYRCLEHLLALGANIVGVITGPPRDFYADYRDLSMLSQRHHIPSLITLDINSTETMAWIQDHDPDIVFCLGWPRMLHQTVLDLPPLGVIGYHAARVQEHRGRHPLVWALVLGLQETASSFFFMNSEADAGDIIDQQVIAIQPDDTIGTLYARCTDVMLTQLTRIMHALKHNSITRTPQCTTQGIFWRKRSWRDSNIDWRMSAVNIERLVRALTRPYHGAHFQYRGQDVRLWSCEVVESPSDREPGSVIEVTHRGAVIATGQDAVRLTDTEPLLDLAIRDHIA